MSPMRTTSRDCWPPCKAELPPLAGIVHAAGEIGTTPLSDLDDAEVDRVFAGKVWGAWHLSEAAADLKLDFFLSTSSIASVWGGFGQTAYGAANAFLDGLSWRLREQGVAGVSVNFGPWSAGMADEEARAKLAKRGIRTLSPADALAGLAESDGVVCRAGRSARCGGPDRLGPKFLPLYQQAGRRAFLAELEREVPSAAPVTTASGKTQLVERLTNAPVQQRRKLMADYLRDAVAEVTRVDPSEIREDAGFFDLGMDSLMAVELRRRIEQGVGKEIPATLAMDHPRLSDVVDYLLGDVLGLSEQASKSGAALGDSGDDAHGRADRDRRGVLPFPRRPQPGSVLGVCCPAVSMRSGKSPRTDSTSTSSTTRIQTLRARRTPASADSSTASTDSIPSSSASLRARPSGSSRSSG